MSSLLFVSGLCGLVFQVTWQREFRLVFGGSTAATGAVLAIFMAGLGLGNVILGRRADRQANPLAFYAQLELFIALSAAASPLLIELVRWIYFAAGGQTALGLTTATVVRLGLAALVLAIPTFLMGGTLPAAARAVTADNDSSRRGTALLYGMNTLGAVAGAALSTFYLLETFGMRASLWLTCGLQVLAAAVAFALSRRLPSPSEANAATSHTPPGSGANETVVSESALAPPVFVYGCAAVVGFAFFLMELVWFRMLCPLLGGTTFTFGLLLALALLGIGIGGAIYPICFFARRPTLSSLVFTCGLEALLLAVPFALGDGLAVLAMQLRQDATSFPGLILGWSVVAGIVMLPASIISGVQFPLLISLLGSGGRNLGRQVGAAFAWNTAGAVVGSLAGGFGILPLLSAPGTWWLVVNVLVGLAIAGMLLTAISAFRSKKTGQPALQLGDWRRRLLTISSTAACAVALLLLTMPGPTAVWRHGGIGAGRFSLPLQSTNGFRQWVHHRRQSVRWEADGVESGVAVAASHGLAFIVDGKSDGNVVVDVATQMGTALMGGVLHPRAKTALVVGLGTGETAGWLAEIDTIQRVDVVELEPAIGRVAADCAAVNHDVLRHPKVCLLYNDGREVLLTARGQYDLIISEPSNPYRSGVANLYTRQYYQAARDRLTDDGLFLQWLQAYEVDRRAVRIVLATLRSVFSHVEMWQTRSRDMLLVCGKQPVAYPAGLQRARLSRKPFRDGLAIAWRTTDLEGFLAHYLAGPAMVDRFIAQEPAPLNTDDCNLLEYGMARSVGRHGEFMVEDLRAAAVALGAHRPPVETDDVEWDRVEDERLAMHAFTGGAVPIHPYLTTDQQSRGKAIQCYLDNDLPGAVATWQLQPRPPANPMELAAMGHAYAASGDKKALLLADRLRAVQPTEAEAIRAVLFARYGRWKEAGAAAANTLRGLQRDPWPLAPIVSAVFRVAIDVARRDPSQAQTMFTLLQQPFAVGAFEETRLATACVVAPRLGPAAVVASLEPLEPLVPWSKSILQLRAKTYASEGHPRARQAQADLEWFRRHEND